MLISNSLVTTQPKIFDLYENNEGILEFRRSKNHWNPSRIINKKAPQKI